MKNNLLILFTIFIFLGDLPAQDPQFTQFYSVPIYLAPSFAGATKQHRIGSAYRNQWTGFPGGFVSYVISYDHYMSSFNSGFGACIIRDYAGSGKLGTMRAIGAYSYDFRLGKDEKSFHIRPGLSFEYFQYSFDFSKLVFNDQITASGQSETSIELPPNQDIRGSYDAAASFIVFNKTIWNGFSVGHLFQPNTGFYAEKTFVPIKYSVFGGLQLSRRSHLLKPIDESVSLAYMYRKQADFQQLDMGLYWFKVPVVFGFWYRGIPLVNSDRGDAIALLFGYKNRYFGIGYSYDFTISNITITSQGSHEISLNYHFQTSRKKRYHAIPCPEF